MAKIPKHRIPRANSRGYDVQYMNTNTFSCEIPGCPHRACTIHHIACSYRGERDDDPKKLIALCHEHDEWIHSHNTNDIRVKLIGFVKKIIDYIK